MCVESDAFKEGLSIVDSKLKVFKVESSLLETQSELANNKRTTNILASHYALLKGRSIALSISAPKCPVDDGWMRVIVGGSAGLSSSVEGTAPDEVTLASMLGYLRGVLGLNRNFKSLYALKQEYRQESPDPTA